MNSDNLIKIAKILDENNLFALADKVDRLAQNFRDMAGLDQTGTGMDKFLKNTRIRNQGGGSWIPGLSNNDTRVMGPFGIDLGSKRFVQRQQAFGKGLRNLVMNTPEYQQYQARYNTQPQQQPQQPQNPLLVSSNPQQFVQNLFAFGNQNKLQTLAQTIDMYAQQGGTFNGQPISQNPQVNNLYNQIKDNPTTFTPQQILAMLSGNNI